VIYVLHMPWGFGALAIGISRDVTKPFATIDSIDPFVVFGLGVRRELE
jgi:hypothetical protein